ncbi:MAG: TonB-dependent siderophore receptor [Pseudomonas sp.]
MKSSHLQFSPLALALALGFSAAGLCSNHALAADSVAASQRHYDVPAGPLGQALSRFAAQAGVLLSFEPAITAGKQTPGLQGRYSVSEGFARLLQGSGLQLTGSDAGGYQLQPSPQGSASLPAASITADSTWDSAIGPDVGFVAKRSLTATKTDTPLSETPQAVSVVTRDQLDAQGASSSLQDSLRYTAGVTSARGVNRTDDSFNLRGFAAGLASTEPAIFRDGLRNYGTYASTIEAYGAQRVEVLKGPASVMYGQAAPGGVINVVSKRPTQEPLHQLDLQYGSNDHRQIGLDLGGPLDEDGVLSYRLTVMKRESDTMTDHVPDNRDYVAGALTWQPSDATSLTVLGGYQHSKTRYNMGVPVMGSVRDNPLGDVSRHFFAGEPDFDDWDTNVSWLGYQFEHHFNDVWTFRQNSRYQESTLAWDSAYAYALDANQHEVDRFAYSRRDRYHTYAVDNQLQAQWQHGDFEHTSLVGLDYLYGQWDYKVRRGAAPNLDIFDPHYGSPISLNSGYSADEFSTTKRTGLYAQDQIKYADHWIFLVGGRQDWSKDEGEYRLYDLKSKADSDAFTGRLGLMYLFDNGLAPYASYTEAFEPVNDLDADGNQFDPIESQQYEVGIKYAPPGTDASLTVSLFDLRRQNVVTNDVFDVARQTGETRSRGVEVEGVASLNANLDIIANYTYTDIEITKSDYIDGNGQAEKGTAPPGVPEHSISLWANYSLHDGALKGLSVGGGVRRLIGTSGYVLESSPTQDKLPAYTVVDALLAYDIDPSWRLALNANNLLDEKYVQSCYYASTMCYYGEERNVVASVRYNW